MKKLNLYSKNNIGRNHLLNTLRGTNNLNIWIFAICMLVFIYGVFWDFDISSASISPYYFLPSRIENQYGWHYTDNTMYVFSAFLREPALALVIGFIVASLQFRFVFVKREIAAELGAGISRRRIYLNKAFYPLLITLTALTLVKVVVLFINLSSVGYYPILLPAFTANLLQTLSGAIFGYIVAVASALLTARPIEFAFFGAGAALLPNYFLEFINKVLGCTLKGYDAEASTHARGTNEIMYNLRFLNPTLGCNQSFNNISEIWISDSPENANKIIIADIIWLVIFGIILTLLGKYFQKSFKPENCKKKGKTKTATLIPCLTVSFIACLLVLDNFGYYNFRTNLLDGPLKEFALSLAIGLVISVAAAVFSTLKPKKAILGILSSVICMLTLIITSAIGYTGGFGFESNIPDSDDIEYISVSTPIQLFTNKHNDYFETFSSQVDYINLLSEKDIKTFRDIHAAFIEEQNGNTGAYCDIMYVLKNGQKIERKYYFLGKDGINATLKLWETDFAKKQYAHLLQTNIPEDDNDTTRIVIERELILNNVHIISKYNNITNITETMNDAGKKALREALYKDICTLSAKDWFYPEHQYGVLALSNSEGARGVMDPKTPIDEFEGNENGQYYFIINSKMLNTVSLLEKYGYMQYFNLDKEIASAHIVETDDMVDWYRNFTLNTHDIREPDGSPVHLTNITWNNGVFDAYAKSCKYDISSFEDYREKFLSDSTLISENNVNLSPKSKISRYTEVSPKKASELIKKGYLSYNTGDEGRFLISFYTVGTYNTVIIPEK